MSSVLSPQAFNPAEPIAGYLVQERIGAGGYGEVWRAEAPGGIAKAIKVVYGHRDDQRAAKELNALNRIKDVRHPFLLSLERIELIDGHLIIVTELASSSLRNLFDQHREAGQPGVRRRSLLTHLSDAADALDYIGQEHSLQHLDVKPENLLLVGGRVKVADFGLVKDLQDVHASIVGGLTPVYAAPELFDGRPNNRSDQYSLAIVYQELLTGVLPFEGRTAAQLAAQHLHSRPRLDPLPICDQATIAKALSKNPAERFASCREMIDSLLGATPEERSRPTTIAPATTDAFLPATPPSKTEILAPEAIQAGAAAARELLASATQPVEPPPPTRELGPLDLAPGNVEYRATIVVGIGGLAALTLQALQRRLVDRFGDIRSVPALQLLLFETDPESLAQATQGEGRGRLNDDSTFLLPLRPPGDYRRETNDHLQWLSRRWIFNIPRSLQTQGFRPLGCLALVDHAERAGERIGRAVKCAVDADGLAASSMKTGLPFGEGPPRVFIVSSISGGTGSGMALDLAYLVRKTLRDLGFPEEGACGILAHCAGRSGPARDLAAANAYAFLSELRHYSDPRHAYPGIPARRLEPFDAGDAPFSDAYVVHLGEELEADDFTTAADKLAEYLYRNTVTPAAAFFDRCRALGRREAPAADVEPTARTFGFCRLGFRRDHVPDSATDELCKSLLARWRGANDGEPAPTTTLANPNSLLVTRFAAGRSEEDLRGEVASRAAAMGLSVAEIVGDLHATALRELGNDPDSYLLAVLEGLANHDTPAGRGANRLPPAQQVFDALNTLIGSRAAQSGPRVCLESVLEKRIEELAATHETALRDWIMGLVASPQHRVRGAQRAADGVVDFLRALSRRAGETIQSPRGELRALEDSLLADKSGSRAWLRRRGFGSKRKRVADKRLSQYFRLRIEELTLNGVHVARLAGLIMTRLTVLAEKLRNLGAELNRLAEEIHQLPSTDVAASRPATEAAEIAQRAVTHTVHAQKTELVAEMERELQYELWRVVTSDPSYVRRVLPHILRRAARGAVVQALKNATLDEMGGGRPPCESIFSPAADLKAAAPRLGACGGARRLLLVAPEGRSLEPLARQIGEEAGQAPTVIMDAESDALLCFEAEDLPVTRMAAAVLDGRFQIVDVASRLHARIDVAWSPL
ncbi:MAG TPA: tubulin-like doman-containing protein [Pirellulales bacterium]|nr:tubulin-like doman-containing protein [Pirellulales bacterium]